MNAPDPTPASAAGRASWGRARIAAAGMAIALLAGCGSSLSHDELVAQAGGAAPSVPGAGGGTGVDATVPAAQAGAAASAGGTQASAPQLGTSAGAGSAGTGTVPTASGTGSGQKSGASNPAANGKSGGPAGTNVTAACTGSKAPVVIGAVGQLSGVLGSAFIGGTRAIQAWITMVNAQGGLGCHPIKYVTADDGGDPSRHLSLVRQLVEQDKVIAMLYQTALLTGQASAAYLESKKIPLIGQEGGELHTFEAPIYFNHGTSGRPLIDFTMIAGARAAKAAGKTKYGTLTCQEVSYCNTADGAWADLGPKLGMQQAYRGKASLLNVDFTSQCLSAKNAGADVLVLAFESTGIHRIAQSCNSVGYHPIIVCTSVQSNLDFRQDAALDGAVIAQPFRPWFLTDSPAIRQYQSVLKQFAPDLVLDSASINGWTAAQLFSRATAAFGADTVTSAGIISALATVKNDDLGGLTYPLTFSADKPQEPKRCGWIMRMQKGDFTSDGQRFCG